MALDVQQLVRRCDTLEQAILAIKQHPEATDGVLFDLYRNAAIKSFELSLETAGKLLRKALKAFEASPRTVDALVFNDVLRHAGKHGILSSAEVERWLAYRATSEVVELKLRKLTNRLKIAVRILKNENMFLR